MVRQNWKSKLLPRIQRRLLEQFSAGISSLTAAELVGVMLCWPRSKTKPPIWSQMPSSIDWSRLQRRSKPWPMTMEKSSHITLLSIKPWDRRPTSPIHIPVGKEVRIKISTALSANTSQKLVRYQRSAMQNLLKSSAFLIIDRVNAWDTKHLSKSL